ncbi:MAG TPA: amidohydrolase family protein [Acidobacteriaceae bacterium]|jgi:L-fuconolactonase|nr:amidohydrolase family protein [Acidobacteriaceae bacterium]
MNERIDAHHHFWRYNPTEYAWLEGRYAPLARDFVPADLEPELRAAGVDGTVLVQVRQSLAETEEMLADARRHSWIRGVLGWAPLTEPGFEAGLERLCSDRKLKGLRHIVQDEPDDNYLLRADFNRGISALKNTGLVYDVLIYERHLPQAIEFVDRHPEQVFVLDHVAKPRIADAVVEPWTKSIRELARRENIYCKVSGMVTEADWDTWTEEKLRIYWEVVLEAFGPRRLMAGSDWPVCLVAASYARWFEIVRSWTAALSASEQDRVLGGTASEAYRLEKTAQ